MKDPLGLTFLLRTMLASCEMDADLRPESTISLKDGLGGRLGPATFAIFFVSTRGVIEGAVPRL